MSLRTWCGAVACAVLMIFAPAARAQDWPNRSMLAVSTVSAGNAGDTIARIVLDQVSKQIGQSFGAWRDGGGPMPARRGRSPRTRGRISSR